MGSEDLEACFVNIYDVLFLWCFDGAGTLTSTFDNLAHLFFSCRQIPQVISCSSGGFVPIFSCRCNFQVCLKAFPYWYLCFFIL